MITYDDNYYMDLAYAQALKAFECDEVPIGALIVIDNKIISRNYNMVETLHDATAHAEMLCITSACEKLGSKFLNNATIYVTIEPCTMCYGAIELTRIGRIVFGAYDEKFGHISRYNCSKIQYTSGLLEDKIKQLMRNFFESKRSKY